MAEQAKQQTIRKVRTDVARASGLLAVAALILIAGCGGFFVYPGSTGSGSTSATGDYMYVANAATSNLAGFAIASGALTAVANSPYALAVSPTALAINPANTILYVAGGAAIYAYAIQTTGALGVLNGGSPVASATVTSMDISPDGQWLLALDATTSGTGGAVDEYRIDSSTGALTPQTTTFSAIGAIVPLAIRISPNAQFVFLALGTAGDLTFAFNTANGTLTALQQLSLAGGQSDNALAVDPTSTYVYIARSGTNGGLAAYAVNGGALSAVSGSPFAASTQPASEKSVALNKAGTAVYVANLKDGAISGFSIGSGGVLTALSGSPYSAGSLVTALAIDNSGNYFLAAAQGGAPDLALYSFDTVTVGKLDLSASSATGTDPTQAVAIAATH